MEVFSAKWFTIYYVTLGVLALSAGVYFLLKTSHFSRYLLHYTESDRPPPAIRNVLKYFFLFTIPCLILSFIPFSWIEFTFSLWSLVMIYVIGIQLVYWEQTQKILVQLESSDQIKKYIQVTGVIMLAVSLVIFMLGFLALNNLSSG